MPKRRRQTSSSSKSKKGNAENGDKVPMPDPPPSLIKLLQKDSKVLEYFTSLQQNLNLDVKRWKDKALDYKSKYKELEQQQSEHQQAQEEAKVDGDSSPKKKHRKPNGKISAKKVKGRAESNETSKGNAKATGKKDRRNTPKKLSHPVQTVEIPAKHVDDDDKEETEAIINTRNDKGVSDASSLSDYSQIFKGPKDEKRKRKPDRKTTTILPNKDQDEIPEPETEDGAPITDEDFFAEFPSGDEENDLDNEPEDEGDSHSSSSGSFGDIEAEFGEDEAKKSRIENRKVDVDESEDMDTNERSRMRDEIRRKALDWLIIAFNDLQMLGVHVVNLRYPQKENEASKSHSDAGDGDDDGHENAPISKSDEEKEHDSIMDFDFDECSGDDSDDNSESVQGFLSDKKIESNGEKKDAEIEDKEEPQVNSRPVITRRTNKEVIKDIMTSLRSLIRIPTLDVDSRNPLRVHYQPFLSKELIPACYPVEVDNNPSDNDLPPHPLVTGLRMLERSLAILDTYASQTSIFSDKNEWDNILAASGKHMDGESESDWLKLESIRIGLMNRDIASMILISLRGEMAKDWAVLDRTARLEIREPLSLAQKDDDEQNNESDFEVQSFNSKNRKKLFGLLERTCLTNIVSGLMQHRGDIDGAAQAVMSYILSTTPSLSLEDHPTYAPVMSFCVLEAMFRPKSPLQHKKPNAGSSWFSNFLTSMNDNTGSSIDANLKIRSLLNKIFKSVEAIWYQRSRGDERMVGVSRAELAAYKRIVQVENSWLKDTEEIGDITSEIDVLFNSMEDFVSRPSNQTIDSNTQVWTCLSLQLMLLINGNISLAINYVNSAIKLLMMVKKKGTSLIQHHQFANLMISCVATCMQLQQIKWQANCLAILTTDLVNEHIEDDSRLKESIESLCHDKDYSSQRSMNMQGLVKYILQCCILIGDGSLAYKAAQSICNNYRPPTYKEKRILFDAIAGIPVVRVINLKCRGDRLKQFIIHARRSQLLTVFAVSPIRGESNGQESSHWGLHAYNGKDLGHLLFEQQIASSLENGKSLNDYVTTHWRPSDLQVFDINARTDDKLVRSSVSERACALSHISSWIGVKNSILDDGKHSETEHLRQLFRISGFASGPSFCPENEGMPPSPVCVIFEDDAMLVDQFNDKLSTLLRELPRDFHFCSIGYSRPKNAPMINYTENIGIPTCFWYLTGYIISLDGTKDLLKSLPVRGPVDSWIGMKATSNWENEYGLRIGVGTAPKAKVLSSELPNRKEFCNIMKFRVFAALTPLCSQKLAWKKTSTSQDRAKWRERDTDVTYSGCQ